MDSQIDLIADITPAKVKFSIKVKVLRLWHQKGFGREKQCQIMELILMDEQGDKIGATVRSKQRPKFQPLLEEGGDYIIRDVSVAENKYKSIHISHPYKLIFAHKTMVNIAVDWNGPLNGFNFVPFNDIVSNSLVINHTADVIGRIVGIGDIKQFDNGNGTPSKLINVDLQDVDGLKISYTFWGKYADQVSDFVAYKEPAKCVIIIIQFAKTKDYMDRLTLSTDWYATKVFMNSDVLEINDFKARLLAVNGHDQPIESLAPAITPSMVTPKSFFDGCKNIGLDEISPSMIGVFVVYATINSIIADDDWCYIACRKCKKMATPIDDVEDLTDPVDVKLSRDYTCIKCGPNPNVYLRFKVQIRVVNETGSASFTLFETDILSMIHKTAYDLRKNMGDDDDIPDELNAIVGKKMLFKVSVTDFNKDNNYQVYTVVSYNADDEVIKLFKEEYGYDEENQSYCNLTLDNGGSSQLNSSAKDAMSVTGENVSAIDLTISTGESPARKRNKNEQDTTPLSVKSSSSKAKRSLLPVKTEKP